MKLKMLFQERASHPTRSTWWGMAGWETTRFLSCFATTLLSQGSESLVNPRLSVSSSVELKYSYEWLSPGVSDGLDQTTPSSHKTHLRQYQHATGYNQIVSHYFN